MTSIQIPTWVSCHTYFFATEDSRTYISNEKTHTYIQLDGVASDLWKLLCDQVDDETLLAFVDQRGVADQLDDFIASLAEQDLVTLASKQQDSTEEYTPMQQAPKTDESEENAFVKEMQAWLFEHQQMFSLFFELTYRCDLKCVHCYNPKHMDRVELDLDLCKRAIDQAYEIGCFRVTFSGGEASLHTHFLDLVTYARSKHMSVEIFTNGQTLAKKEELYNAIKALYPYRICVSLYSTDENTHEQVTAVDGSFANSYGLIERMKKDNLNVQIKNFLLNFNCTDCVKVKQFAAGIGATSIADISLIPTIEGERKTMQFALSEEQLFALYTDPASPLYLSEKFKPFVLDDKLRNAQPCAGGWTGLCVNPNAEVILCVSMPYSVGNLKEESLVDIWNAAMQKDPNSKLYQWQQVR